MMRSSPFLLCVSAAARLIRGCIPFSPNWCYFEQAVDSDEDSLFGSGSEDSSSSDESEDDGRRELKGRARWLKKAPTAADSKKKEEVVKKDRPVQKKKEYAEPTVQRRPASTFMESKLTEEELDRKVGELLAVRGKRTTDSREVLRQLEVLTKAARLHGPRKEIPVLMHLISNMLDSQRSIDDYLEHNQWRTCYRSLYRVVSLLEANKRLSFASVSSEDGVDAVSGAHLKAQAADADAAPTDPNVLKVAGSLVSFIVRLQDEYTKSLQQINPHTKVR
jgi:translation initiation factor 3 subunit C